MKAIQRIIFFLSMAIVLMLCQKVFAANNDPAFIKDKQTLDATKDREFNKNLEQYSNTEKIKAVQKEEKLKAAKKIVDETQSWVQYTADFIDFRDNALEEAIKTGLNAIGAEVAAAEKTANMVNGKCMIAALTDAVKIAKCREATKALEEYVEITREWSDAKAEYESYKTMQSSDTPVYYAIDCQTDAKGEKKCVRIYFKQDCDDDTGKCTYTQTSGISAGCTPLPIKLSETKTCLFCPLFKVVFDAANTMATSAYSTLGRPLAMIMLIGLAIYIAFKVMILTSGFVKQDAPKFITETLTQSFKVLVAYILLYNAGQIYVYAISPVLAAGLEFGTAIMGGEYSRYLKDCAVGNMGASSGILSSALYARLDCFIRAVQEEIAIPQSIGSSLMCVAIRRGAVIKYIIPDFSMLLIGLIIWAFAWLVMLAFGFYLIDATIRIGIVGALMPFLIATWPFKATAKYASTGWNMILNTFFVYVFLGIVIAVNVTLMFVSIGGEDGQAELSRLISGDSVKEIKEKLDIGLSGFLILIIGCLFGFKLTGQASSLASSFAGGAGPDLAPKIGGLMASGATGAGKWVGGKAFGGGKRALESLGVGEKYRTARDGIKRGVSRVVSGAFGGGDPSKSSKKPTIPTTSPNAGTGFVNNQNPKQQGDNTQQQQTSGTGGTNPNNGAPTPNNKAPQGGNLNPQNNVDNAINAGPRGSENATPQRLNHLAQAHMDSYKAYLDSYKNDKNQSATDALVAQKSAQALSDFKNNASIDEQAKRSTLPSFEAMDALNQNKADSSQKAMKDSAIRAYTQKRQAEAVSQGKSFNAQKVEDYATENFDDILSELDSIVDKDE